MLFYMLTITYIRAMALDIHIQSRFNNHTACRLYRILVMATSVVGVMKIRNIVPRAGNKPTSLAFRAGVLPLYHVGYLMSPLFPRPPVYADYYSFNRIR